MCSDQTVNVHFVTRKGGSTFHEHSWVDQSSYVLNPEGSDWCQGKDSVPFETDAFCMMVTNYTTGFLFNIKSLMLYRINWFSLTTSE